MKQRRRVSHEEKTFAETSFAANPFRSEFSAVEGTPEERIRAWIRYYGFGVMVLLVMVACGVVLVSDLVFPHHHTGDLDLEVQQLAEMYSSNQLLPGGGTTELWIDSYPSNATVFIDFDSVGVTPIRVPSVPVGLHVVSVNKEGYELVDTVLSIYERKSDWIVLKMRSEAIAQANTQPSKGNPVKKSSGTSNTPQTGSASKENVSSRAGTVNITSNPKGASVRLDGEIIGQTPLVLDNLKRGQYAIRLEMSGHVPYSTVLQIEPGDDLDVHGQLKSLTEKLTLQISPSGKIIIDGVVYATHAEGKFVVNLPIGKHTLVVEHQSKRRFETEIELKPNRPRSLIIDLSR